jgi:hypothetical protein
MGNGNKSVQSRTDDDDYCPSICIAVATHKAYRMPFDRIYLPLQVGKALHPEVDLGFQRDDEGDNISTKNASYSELTGLYWMWKNCTTPYKGLVHYRRHFASLDFSKRFMSWNRFNRIASSDDVSNLLKVTNIILPRKRDYFIETVYSHYSHTFDGEQFDETRKILLEYCPEYVHAFDGVMKSKTVHIFNMFIMSRNRFDEYCAWMFPIIDELVRRIPPQKYNAFGARYPGRVSERLLDVWINTNGYKYRELPVVSPEPVNWRKKVAEFLLAKFTGKKYEKSF